MFKNNLQKRFERIFGFKKTTFLAPSETFEQDTLFIEILSARTRLSGAGGGFETAKVTGEIVVFSQDNRLPYGFFAKRLENGLHADTKDLFFYELDFDNPESPARTQNIHERRASFIFLYNSQYDPDKGLLNEITMTMEE